MRRGTVHTPDAPRYAAAARLLGKLQAADDTPSAERPSTTPAWKVYIHARIFSHLASGAMSTIATRTP